ncbi:hypothetical protein Pcinc_028543 [Petrolisthes cinctipes]|uniref:RRM domain-containing protein n=1 Tax=Petrolisthes cinctipes TaxID=88211 RepID=A0AAE1F2T9_PETCI|nr:hypothetical protein Pcinc_028543 [Petrolisthes cinctipes]
MKAKAPLQAKNAKKSLKKIKKKMKKNLETVNIDVKDLKESVTEVKPTDITVKKKKPRKFKKGKGSSNEAKKNATDDSPDIKKTVQPITEKRQKILDQRERTIIVTNFNSKTKKPDLHKFFSNYGKVEDVLLKLKNDTKGKKKTDGGKVSKAQKKIAHIRFTEKDMAQGALKANKKMLMGNCLFVGALDKTAVHQVFVRNLIEGVTKEELRGHFAQCGDIEKVIIVHNEKKLREKKGYGFISFKSGDAVQKALQLNCKHFMKQLLVVKLNDKKGVKKLEGKLTKKEILAQKQNMKKEEDLSETKLTESEPDMKKTDVQAAGGKPQAKNLKKKVGRPAGGKPIPKKMKKTIVKAAGGKEYNYSSRCLWCQQHIIICLFVYRCDFNIFKVG